MSNLIARRLVAFLAAFAVTVPASTQQMPDPDFDASVAQPAYVQEHPRVVIDEAHFNFHTAKGGYAPFAQLLRNDGYDVGTGTSKFDDASLRGVRVLVISNALGSSDHGDAAAKPAFTDQECDAVYAWVRAGGSLLLIADHAPMGSAAANLGKRFGVDMGAGYVFDAAHGVDGPSILAFDRNNGLLGEHVTLQGRRETEIVRRLVSFTGQSLSIPQGASVLMKLSPTAREAPDVKQMQGGTGISAGGRAQGLALEIGRGRVVMMGEAGMLTAQLIRRPSQPDFRFGMNVSGNDNRQFALNVMHWLSRAQ
jgi:hypothetical protein